MRRHVLMEVETWEFLEGCEESFDFHIYKSFSSI